MPKTDNLAKSRKHHGQCPTCGIKTHKFKLGMTGKRKIPLTVPRVILHGRCLACHPMKDIPAPTLTEIKSIAVHTNPFSSSSEEEEEEEHPISPNPVSTNPFDDVEGEEAHSNPFDDDDDNPQNDTTTSIPVADLNVKDDSSSNDDDGDDDDDDDDDHPPTLTANTDSPEEKPSIPPDNKTPTKSQQQQQQFKPPPSSTEEESLKTLQSKNQISIEDIIHLMESNLTSHAIQKLACLQLKNLARNVENKRLILSHGGIKPLILTMNTHAELSPLAFSAMAQLTCRDCTNQREIANAGLIPMLLSSMEQFSEIQSIQEEGCTALYNLTLCPSHLFRLWKEHPTEIIESAARRFPSQCGSMARVILENMMLGEKRSVDLIRSSDLKGEDVVLVMKNCVDSGLVQNVGCMRIEVLTRDVSKDVTMDFGEAIVAMIDAMIKHKKVGNVQFAACAALGNICRRDVLHKSAIVREGGIYFVVKAMKKHPKSVDVQEEACLLLQKLTSSQEEYLDFLREEKPEGYLKAAGKHFPEKCKKLSDELLNRLHKKKYAVRVK